MKKSFVTTLLLLAMSVVISPARAADYDIDTHNAHAFIQFKIKHLGYSWLIGRFNTFNGWFKYDEKHPSASKVEVNIDVASIDSNHAERDKHLRSKDFLDVDKYPVAKFVSTSYKETGKHTALLKGMLTLHGVTKPVTLKVKQIGHGADPWGGYRRGFEASTTLTLKDFGINYDLGPAARTVQMYISFEGIRRK